MSELKGYFTIYDSYGIEFDSQLLEYSLDEFSEEVSRVTILAKMVSGTATSIFIGAATGGAVWMMSSTYLVALASSSLPAWSSFDPIFVLRDRADAQVDDDLSLAQLIQQSAQSLG